MASTPEARLAKIAEAHFKYTDEHGGTYGECNECNQAHPCPTYIWATTERDDTFDTWDPCDDEKCPGQPVTPGVSADGRHCLCWYEGQACHRCSAPATNSMEEITV